MKLVKIKDIGKVVSGSTPSRVVPEYWNGNIPWITPKEINQLKTPYLNQSVEKITELGLKSCSATMLPKGTVIFSSRAPIGLVAVSNIEVCTNQGFKSIIPNNDIDSLYLYYVLKANTQKLNDLGTGTTFKELSKSAFENYKIPLPETLQDQQKIAYILSKAEALIQKRKETLKLLDEFLKSTFLDMFGDPVKNPKGWKKIKLENIIKIKHGFAFKSEYFSNQGEFILLTPGNFNEDGGYAFKEEKQKYYVGSYPKEYLLEKDSLLIAMTEQASGLLGSTIKVPDNDKFLHNQRLGLVVFDKNEISTNFLLYLFNSPHIRRIVDSKATGTKVRHTSPTKIEEIYTVLPPKELQTQFAKIVEKVEGIKQQQEASLKEIENLYNSLMQRAFKGELSLDKVEIETEKSDWNINSIQEKLTDVFQEIKKGSIPFGNNLKEFYDSAIQPQILKGSYFSVDYIEKLAKGLIDNSSVIRELSGNNYSHEQIEQFANSVRIVDTTTDATESNFKLEFDSVETNFDEINGGFVTEEEAKPVLEALKTDMVSYLESLPPIKSKDKKLIKKIRDLDAHKKQIGKIEFDEDYAIYRVLEPHFSKEDSKSLAFPQIFELLKDFTNINYDVAKEFIFNDLSKEKTYFEQIYKEDHKNEIYQVELKLKL